MPSAREKAVAAVSQSVRGPFREIVLSLNSPGVRRIDPRAVPTSLTADCSICASQWYILVAKLFEMIYKIKIVVTAINSFLTCYCVPLRIRRQGSVKNSILDH